MIIQILLIAFSLLAILYFLRNEGSMHIRAYKKLAFLAFVTAMVIFILSPETLNKVAEAVGVGRGADLLLYGFFFVFLLFAINVYTKFKKDEDTVYRLARKIALIEAERQKKTNQ